MEVKFTPMYSCQLVLDLEKERNQTLRLVEDLTDNERASYIEYGKRFFVTKYCQMGVNRRWYDFQKEVARNVNAIDNGRIDEVTMPELITDVDAWSDEDKLVYKALKESKTQRIGE